MPAAARQTDAVSTGHLCDGTTTLAAPGQGTVYIENLLACRITDKTVVHEIKVGLVCVPHDAPITGSSDTVYIVNKKAARKTDGCDAGTITGGASTVFIG